MAILRGPLPADGYTIISNSWLRDPALSWKAKGLLAYIASHAPGHQLTSEQIVAEGGDGKDAVRAGLVELERRGYLMRTQLRGDGGRIVGTNYALGDPQTPAEGGGFASAGKPDPGPDQEKQDVPAAHAQSGESGAGKPAGKKTNSKKTREDQEPFDAEASPTAQTIIGSYLDWLEPQGVTLPRNVVARYGKTIKSLLAEGFDAKTIKRALVVMTERGKAGWPSLLESFTAQVQNQPVSSPPSAQRSFRQMDRDAAAMERLKAQAMDALMEANPQLRVAEARKIIEEYAANGQLNLNNLNARTVTSYIDGEIDGEAIEPGLQEVTP